MRFNILVMLKNLWLIWCRTVDHRIGKTNDDEPNIPILTLKQAQISLLIRSFIILVNLITYFFIIVNMIHICLNWISINVK